MALTWAFSMDGSAPESRGCRTLIELRHFVRPFPTKLRFYKHIASSTNLSYDEVAATGCRFGRSVVKPEKEYRSLFRASHVFGLKGFHDQAAFFNLSEVRLALAAAFKRAQGCPRLTSCRRTELLPSRTIYSEGKKKYADYNCAINFVHTAQNIEIRTFSFLLLAASSLLNLESAASNF
jgi:hypothetical protein